MLKRLNQLILRIFFLNLTYAATAGIADALEPEKKERMFSYENAPVVGSFKAKWAKTIGYNMEDLGDFSWIAALNSCWSIGCLDFLNGVSGKIEGSNRRPAWTHNVCRYLVKEANEKDLSAWINEIDYIKGIVSYTIGTQQGPQKKTMKIGKVLSKLERALKKDSKDPKKMIHGLDFSETVEEALQKIQDYKQEFQTRKGFEYRWMITTDPKEVACMSYNRGWTSCMNPDGCAKYGVISDMEAGSACLFFYKPNQTDQPLGRIILRPVVTRDDKPTVLISGRIYGEGTKITAGRLKEEILRQKGININVEEDVPLNKFKHTLANKIYDDATDHAGSHKQTKEQRRIATKYLQEAFAHLASLETIPPTANELMKIGNTYGQKLSKIAEEIEDEREQFDKLAKRQRDIRGLIYQLERKKDAMLRNIVANKHRKALTKIKETTGINMLAKGFGSSSIHCANTYLVECYSPTLAQAETMLKVVKGKNWVLFRVGSKIWKFTYEEAKSIFGTTQFGEDKLEMLPETSCFMSPKAAKKIIGVWIKKSLDKNPHIDGIYDLDKTELRNDGCRFHRQTLNDISYVLFCVAKNQARAQCLKRATRRLERGETTHITDFGLDGLDQLGQVPQAFRDALSGHYHWGWSWTEACQRNHLHS